MSEKALSCAVGLVTDYGPRQPISLHVGSEWVALSAGEARCIAAQLNRFADAMAPKKEADESAST